MKSIEEYKEELWAMLHELSEAEFSYNRKSIELAEQITGRYEGIFNTLRTSYEHIDRQSEFLEHSLEDINHWIGDCRYPLSLSAGADDLSNAVRMLRLDIEQLLRIIGFRSQ